MAFNDKDDDRFEILRQKAEALIAQGGAASDDLPRDMLGLIQELRVHQVELEIQNEELQAAQEEVSALNREYVELYYENAPCGYVNLGPSRLINRLNRTAVRFMGAGDDTLRMIGKPLTHFLSRHGEQVYLSILSRSLQTGRVEHGEMQVKRPDGRGLWVRADLITDRDDQDRVSGHRLTMVDVTERRQADQALRRSEARLRSIIDAAPFGAHLYALDAADRLILEGFNDVAQRILGTDHRPLVGKTIADAFPLLADSTIPQRYAQVAATGKPYDAGEVGYDDGTVNGIFEVHAVQTAPGQMAAFFRDISDQKHAEAALEESEQRFRTMADGLPLIVWVHDAEGRQQFVNRTFYEFFGLSPSDLEDDRWRDLLHPDDVDAYLDAFAACVRKQRPFNQEVRVKRADGQWRWVESIGRPRFDAAGEFAGMVGTSVDVTQRKEAAAAQRRMNQTLERQVRERTAELTSRARKLQHLAIQLSEAEERERKRIARLLHDDLQQDLAAVKMKLDVLVPDVPGRRDADAYLDQCTAMLHGAIEKTRKLSRDLNPIALKHRRLRPCLEALANQFKRDHGLDVAIRCAGDPASPPLAITDFLLQAIRELLFNVVKHSGSAAAQVVLREDADGFKIQVTDDGKGGVVDEIVARRGVAPGLGLFSIDERIQALGGKLIIESIPGDGWAATLVIPQTVAGPPAPAAGLTETVPAEPSTIGRVQAPPTEWNAIRILVVDDHEAIREGLVAMLDEQKGFHVIGQASNGREAVKMTGTHHPDVVMMDIQMPGMNGVEATGQIVGQYPGIAVVGLTMHDDEATRGEMIAAGAAACLSKSDSAAQIIQTIRKAAQGSLP